VWFGILALGLTVLCGGVWSGLLIANLSTSPAVPWCVGVMALVLWLAWQYLGGRWRPASTSETRRHYLRARPVSVPVFAWAVLAGVLGTVALVGLWIVLFQLVKVRGNPLPDFSQYPLVTVVLVIGMAAFVFAVIEEAGFRGYFQSALEETIRGPLAILIAAAVMVPGHGLTQGFALPTVLFYLFVDVMFGATAYLTRSILPSLVTHFIGLVVFFSLVWPNDASRPMVAEEGADWWFWLHVAQTVLFASLAIAAFWRLARATGGARLEATTSAGG
jgi:membrane protease YdiL (CAAX protease family)